MEQLTVQTKELEAWHQVSYAHLTALLGQEALECSCSDNVWYVPCVIAQGRDKLRSFDVPDSICRTRAGRRRSPSTHTMSGNYGRCSGMGNNAHLMGLDPTARGMGEHASNPTGTTRQRMDKAADILSASTVHNNVAKCTTAKLSGSLLGKFSNM